MRKETQRLIELDRERTILENIGAMLGWDQETYMPENAVAERAKQAALISGLAHEKSVMPEIGQLLDTIETLPSETAALEPMEAAYIRVLRNHYNKETKIPAALVVEMAEMTSLSQAAWAKAREANDFNAFAPYLQKMIDLNKRVAAALDPAKKPYDVLLDIYEDGATEASIAAVFTALRKDLIDILSKIRKSPQIDDAFLRSPVSEAQQEQLSQLIMDWMCLDKTCSRLDKTAHPFTTTLGEHDVRITTRYVENYFPSSIFSTIHEAGHALYELGIAPGKEYAGTRLAEPTSTAIHESQSRLWENIIGRSPEFWKTRYAQLVSIVAPALDTVSMETFIRAINKVEQSLIRTEADEVSYALHVILRFEMESAMIAGTLAVKDVPAVWNAKMKELLGVDVPDDSRGCLQDVHWSLGYFGYFPGYALGNLYAAQLWDTMQKDIPELGTAIAEGKNDVPLAWLRSHVHRPGSLYLPEELIQKITGAALDPSHFTRYLRKKYSKIYQLQ